MRSPTLEEILENVVLSIQDANKEVPCRENALAITKIQEAIMWLEFRAKDRAARGVLGTKEE